MSCVAQGGPYLLGTAVALRAMTSSARRRRLAGLDRAAIPAAVRAGPVAPVPSEPAGTSLRACLEAPSGASTAG
jgi:hypothetical protein